MLTDSPPTEMHTRAMTLGPWVEMRTETCRGGRRSTVAVNCRDGSAMLLDDTDCDALDQGRVPDGDLGDALESNGFLADRPAPAVAPKRSRFLHFLHAFDTSWAGADRPIAAIHERVLHRAWHPRWIAVQIVVAIAGIVALADALGSGRPLALRPSPLQIPGYIALSLLAVAVHELAHGLVLSHHGRRVKAVGFRLHLGSPAFYVESVEALLLTRRQRLLQAAAGVWAEWQFTSIVAVALAVAPEGTVTPILQRFVVLTAFTIATNLLPFAGLDGALLFADLIREPNLAADSKDAMRRLNTERRAGDGPLLAYAVANTLVSTALLATAVWFWFLLFGGLLITLTAHGTAGWFGAAALLGLSFGPALAGVVPHLRRLRPIDRALFRIERTHRIRLTETLATVAPFDTLDDRSLSVLAGQLHLRRVRRGTPLHEPGFTGYLAVDHAIDLGTGASLHRGDVARIDGPGVAATTRRPFVPVHAGLLPTSALRLVGLTSA